MILSCSKNVVVCSITLVAGVVYDRSIETLKLAYRRLFVRRVEEVVVAVEAQLVVEAMSGMRRARSESIANITRVLMMNTVGMLPWMMRNCTAFLESRGVMRLE